MFCTLGELLIVHDISQAKVILMKRLIALFVGLLCLTAATAYPLAVKEFGLFGTPQDPLRVNEPLGDATARFTEAELPTLLASAPGFTQELVFKDERVSSGSVLYTENEEDVEDYFLVIEDDDPFVAYEMRFDALSGTLTDCGGHPGARICFIEGLIGREYPVLGERWTIAHALVTEWGDVVLAFETPGGWVQLTVPQEAAWSSVVVGSERIEDLEVTVDATLDAFAEGAAFMLHELRFELFADAEIGSRAYVPAGGAVSMQLDEPEGMLGNWDLRFYGTDGRFAVVAVV